MLEHSKGLPLAFEKIRILCNNSPKPKAMLAQNLHRIRELRLAFDDCRQDEVTEWTRKVLDPDAASMLKTLVVDYRNYWQPKIVKIPDVALKLSSLAVNGGWPDFPAHRMQEALTSFRNTLLRPGLDGVSKGGETG